MAATKSLQMQRTSARNCYGLPRCTSNTNVLLCTCEVAREEDIKVWAIVSTCSVLRSLELQCDCSTAEDVALHEGIAAAAWQSTLKSTEGHRYTSTFRRGTQDHR